MRDWNNEPEFQTWRHLFSYYGDFLDFEVYYRFEESPEDHIKITIGDDVSGSDSTISDSFTTIDDARAYIEQFKEKLMKLASYEEQLDFY